MAIYPASVLPSPLVNHSAEWTSTNRTSNPINGPAINERISDDSTYMYSVTWNMTQYQWRVFQGWFFHKINNGADWFDIDMPLFEDAKGGLKTVSANFMNDQPKPSRFGTRIIVTAKLSIRNLQVYRDTEAFIDQLIDFADNGYPELSGLITRLEQFSNFDMQVIPS